MPSNEDREDFLTEDPEIPGQKFALLSFLSPEKVLSKKDHFLFEKFLGTYEFTFRVKSLEEFLMRSIKTINDKLSSEADKLEALDLSGSSQLVRDARIRMDTLMTDLQTFVKANQSELKAGKLKEEYDEFLYKNREKLEDEFYALNDFRTTVRGLKIRGVYGSKEEATARSKKLQRIDTVHNIFVGEIGKWLPWDPEPSQVTEQEYAEDQLNTLMKKYKENEEAREQFEREKRERAARSKKTKAAEDLSATEAQLPAATRVENLLAAGIGAAVSQEVHNLFSEEGPADLAIARKMGKND